MNHISTSAADRRQTYRLAIHHQSRLTLALDGPEPEDDAIHGVTLTDISHQGLMAANAGHLIPGAHVLLEVALVGWREAEVRWIAGNRAGCRFAEPLTLDELRLAAVSSERLAGECPALAEAIANMPPLERPTPVTDARSPAESSRMWRFGFFLLVGLGGASFAAANWLLNHLG
jgi:hypothetical protein